MDLLEQPEVKSKYDKCKYIVKLWEHNFKKKHKRMPSKLDIREADVQVKQAYKKYFQLKTSALEQSFRGVEGFSDEELELNLVESLQVVDEEVKRAEAVQDDKWGDHLNKIVQEAKNEKVVDKTNLNTSITKKLFCGSKFTKRNPRKSQSFLQNKSDLSLDASNVVSPYSDNAVDPVTNITEENDPIFSFEGLFKTTQVKVVDKISTHSTNIVQSVLENKCKPLKSVDAGWLKRIEQYNGIEIQTNELNQSKPTLDFDSDDDIIDNSDEECSINLGPLAKKPKLAHVENKPNALPVVSQKLNETTLISNVNKNDCVSQTTEKSNPIDTIELFNQIEKFTPTTQNKRAVFKANDKKNNVEINKICTPTRQSRRSTMHKKSMNELSSGEEDPYASDTDSKDPEFNVNGKNELVQFFVQKETEEEEQEQKERDAKVKSKKTKTIKKANDANKDKPSKTKKSSKKEAVENEEANDEDVSQEYELEYSVKPRVSAPRFKNLKKLINSETHSQTQVEDSLSSGNVTSKSQQEKEKFLKKIESGSLNENFVTINLKKKVFVRGKKNTNFSRYKKQQWKSKKKAAALAGPDMDMGGCDGGTLTCFQCGGTGHFARNCPKTKGDALLPLEAEHTVCAYPTLEEAAQMARDSALAVRTSNLAVRDEKPESDDSSDEIFDEIETEKMLAEMLKLEEHVAKLDLQSYLDCTKIVDPVYKLDERGEIIDTPLEVLQALSMFGHGSFRPGQEQAVMRILSGKSTLVTLSTGSGKSLCYQLPAYLYAKRTNCISLIISPLVSLMEDQVTGIPSFLKAACLHTNKTKIQREKILEALSSGGLDVLLVSPEAVVAGEKSCGFGSLLRKLPPIAFACIDEAHCVSQWSHNFRPSYLMICRVLRERMGVKTILGLTATATRATSDSIINHLQIPDGRDGIISDVPLPDNLILTVSKDAQRQRALLQLLISERFNTCKSIIIYCTRREQCDKLSGFLRTSLQLEALPKHDGDSKKRKRKNHQVEAYHAGLSASKRRSVQNAFMAGNLKIVVATVAFGMGINKSDIRSVIHFNMPKNFESYVQEIGRAGRDGLPAYCHVFLDPEGNDENELRRHIFSDSIDRHMIRKLLQRIFLPCSCKGVCPKHEVAFSIEETVKALDLPEENIATLLCYLELHENKYIETLSPAYTACKIISYNGALGIKMAAKECPPLAMALALQKNKDGPDQNVLEFAVVDIAAAIGWDSGICKSKLKNLEWTTVNGQPKRSTLNVEFSNLGFRLLAPGNLTDDQLDEALDSLHEHVVNQEEKSLLQLRSLHQALTDVTSPSYQSCLLPNDAGEKSIKLKTKIRDYFESPDPLASVSLTRSQNSVPEDLLIKNIQALLCVYKDNTFTGRAVARIFHGISSPNYPAVIWGRCKYWRAFINADYHTICKLATREILNSR